jgi:hypothetical protein
VSEVRTPPKKLVDLNPRWATTASGEIYGIRYNCPCGLPCFNGEAPYSQCCPCGGRQVVPTKTTWDSRPVCADSQARGWDLTGTSFDNITLSPSIHQVGHWHGWLRNGVLESC